MQKLKERLHIIDASEKITPNLKKVDRWTVQQDNTTHLVAEQQNFSSKELKRKICEEWQNIFRQICARLV